MSKTKKIIVVGCILLCILFLFTGCKRDYKFTFSYNLETREYTHGSNVELSASIKNDSGCTYSYYGGESDFEPHIYLYNESNGVKYVMPMDIPSTHDMGKFRIENGVSKTRTVYFTIPSDATLGEYNLRLSYLKSSIEYENVLKVV